MNKVQYPAYDISANFTEEKDEGTQGAPQARKHKSKSNYFVGHSSYSLQY